MCRRCSLCDSALTSSRSRSARSSTSSRLALNRPITHLRLESVDYDNTGHAGGVASAVGGALLTQWGTPHLVSLRRPDEHVTWGSASHGALCRVAAAATPRRQRSTRANGIVGGLDCPRCAGKSGRQLLNAAHQQESHMTARALVQPFPIVTPDTDAMAAATTLAAQRLPGLIVCADDGRPYTILPGSQVLRFLIPTYVQDDPALARVLDEQASDELCRKLVHSTVRDLLPEPADLDELPVVEADATALEVAAVMARMHSPLVAVVDERDGNQVIGAITVRQLLEYLLPQQPAN